MGVRSQALPCTLATLVASATMALLGCSPDNETSTRPQSKMASPAPRPDQLSRSIRPGQSIGPIRLNEPRSNIESQLGPGKPDSLDPNFVTWPTRGGELAVTFDTRDRVVTMRTNSPVFRFRGYTLASGLGTLRRALPRWKFLACGPSKGLTLNHGPRGPSTTLAFYDGPPIRYTREIGFPVVVVSVYHTDSACVG